MLRHNGFQGGQHINMGQTQTSNVLIMPDGMVKAVYKQNKDYLHGAYADAFHTEYRNRMGIAKKPAASSEASQDAVPADRVPDDTLTAPLAGQTSGVLSLVKPFLQRFGVM